MKIEEYEHPELIIGRHYVVFESRRGKLAQDEAKTVFLKGISKYEKDHFIIDLEVDGRVKRGVVVPEMWFHERYLELVEQYRSSENEEHHVNAK